MKTNIGLPNKFFSVAILFILLGNFSFAQQTWERNYGGPGSEYGRSVQQTSDGGYIVAGYLHDLANHEFPYLFKTNASGDTLWTRTYFGYYNQTSMGSSVQQTQDGGYIVAGGGVPPSDWAWLLKTNASGDSLWCRSYGGGTSAGASSVQQTLEGGYIFTGRYGYNVNARVYLVKTNASGDALWTRTYGDSPMAWGNSVQQTSDTGYVIAGSIGFPWIGQAYLVKTNASGDTLWTRTYGGSKEDNGVSVQQTQDGGYIIAGYSYSFRDTINGDAWLVKTNAAGDTLWTRTYGGSGYDVGNSVRQTQDGGYIITGSTYSFSDTLSGDAWLIKTNANGDTLWTRRYGGTGIDQGNSVRQTTDLGYIVAGFTGSFGNGSQVYLIKTNANGNHEIEEEADGRRTDDDAGLRIHPNLFRDRCEIRFTMPDTRSGKKMPVLRIYDATGRLVRSFDVPRPLLFVSWDGRDDQGVQVPAGVYFIRAETQNVPPVRVVKIR